MKLWLKVFWCTFLLFEVLFNASSMYLIQHNFNRNLVREVDKALSDKHMLADQIVANWSYIDNLNQLLNTAKDNPGEFLQRNAAKYLNAFDPDKVSVEIKDAGGQTIFTTFTGTISGQRPELEVKAPVETNYMIRAIGPRSVLFVTGLVQLSGQAFKLTYIQDLTDIYEDRNAQIRTFIKINIVIAIVLAAGLYGIIRFLTRSVRMLADSAQTIASGRYAHRVHVRSKDEIGLLAEQFNIMAEAIEEKVNALETSTRSKQRFIQYLTHELKTPLTSIIGYADLLRATTYNEAVFRKSLNYIYGEGKRLESLAFKLVDLILVEHNQPRMTLEPIKSVLEETGQLMRPQLEQGGINLSVDAEPARLPMDRDLLQLLFTNLLDNAIKASEAGDRIGLRGYGTEDSRYVIEVQDEGIGIAEQDLANVLEPFFKGDPIRSHANHGAGLGLAIGSEIVRLHKGELHIRSRPNEGTVVRVILPGAYNSFTTYR